MTNKLTRREFVAGVAGTAMLGSNIQSLQGGPNKLTVCIFSKHLQWLDYEQMAETAAELGFDGVDLTVRPGGHILPENVKTDLPKAVTAVKAAGLKAPMMTTRITDAADPNTEPILATAAELGIEDYRTGSFKYSDDTSIQRTLRGIKSKLAEIAQLNEKYGIRGQYQNHAGGQNFGAAVWDLAGILRQIDSEWLGCQFDIRHATVEGGTTWPLEFRLISSHVQSADIKDFIWVEKNGKWATQNCPLGEGMVDFEKYLPMLAKSNFGGPLSLHYEYDLGGANSGKSELSIPKSKVLGAMKKDLAFFRKELTKANL